jgi:hypothetical protein
MTEIVLIGGMPRSGTTLLSRLIGEKFQIPFSPETHYFSLAYNNDKLATEGLPNEVLSDPRVSKAYHRIEGLPRSIETFRILLRDILGDTKTIGEKTPAHLTAFSDILKSDANVVAIVMKRDFFEVIESLRKVHWNNASFQTNLRRCVRYHRAAHITQRQFRDRLLVVDYRTLCEDEQSVIDALAKWLPRGKHCDAQQIFDPAVEPWKKNALSAPKVIKRQVPLQRIHLWLIAKLAFILCNIVWPLKTVHSQ